MCKVAHLDRNPPFCETKNNPEAYLWQRAVKLKILIASRIVRNFFEKKSCKSSRFLLLVPFNFLFTKSLGTDVADTGQMVFAVFNQAGSY